MEEIRLGSINKNILLKNKLLKGDLKGAATILLKALSSTTRRELVLLLLSSYRPYSTSFHFLEQTFLQTF